MNRVIRDGKTGDIRFFLLIGPNSYSTVSFDVSCWEEAWSLMQRKPIDWIREQKDTRRSTFGKWRVGTRG